MNIQEIKNKSYGDLTPQEKLKISYELMGKNKVNCKNLNIDHIVGVLKKFNISPLEASQIMIDRLDSNSEPRNETIAKPIAKYLKETSALLEPVLNNIKVEKGLKPFADYFQDLQNKEEDFLISLKELFNTERAKMFSLLIRELEREEVLNIGDGEFVKFFKSAQLFFDRDVGVRRTIEKYRKVDYIHYKKDIDIISKKLKPLLNEFKNH